MAIACLMPVVVCICADSFEAIFPQSVDKRINDRWNWIPYSHLGYCQSGYNEL